VRIDVHSHYIPDCAMADVRAGRGVDGIQTESHDGAEWLVHPRLEMRYPLMSEFFDRDAKLSHMDRLGIDVSVLSIVPLWLLHWVPDEIAQTFCQRANDWLAEFVSGSDRLLGMATVPLQMPEAAARELGRARNDLDLRGVQIGTTVAGIPLDDERYAPFFHAAQELDIPVMIHPSYGGRPSPFADFYLKNLIGNPLATAVAASRLILSGFLDRYPNLKLILVHAGGFMPYQIGRLDHGYEVRAETRARIEQTPSQYLRRFHFDTITHAAAPLKFLTALIGYDRVVFGTDSPFDMGDTEFGKIIGDCDLPTEAMSAIESGTAAELFKIEK